MFFVTAKNASYQIACGKKGKGASSPTELTPLLHEISVLERVLGSEAGFVAAKNSKNGLKSTFCPQDTSVEREALPQTLSRTEISRHEFGLDWIEC